MNGGRRWWVTGALVVAVVCGASVAGERWWSAALRAPGPLSDARAFVIPHGGTNQLAEMLAQSGVIDRLWLFRGAVWLTRNEGPLRAAEFAFPAHASIRQVLAIVRAGRPVQHHLTIAEGLTAQQIVAVLAHAEAMTGEVRAIEEGSVLPQTYDFERGADRAAVVVRAKAAMDKGIAAAWADRAPGLAISSPREAVILASIVERETARPDERAHVASVYLNRLRRGMKLQADPTVVYLASQGAGVLDHHLTRAELARDDPFNTYRSAGLPPAPICSPGSDSVRAVLHPAVSDDLFFVADGSGGHVFSRSYEEHAAAVNRRRGPGPSAPHGGPE